MTRRWIGLAAIAALPGCELVEAFLDGIARLKAEPQFAFVRHAPAQVGTGAMTVEVTVGTVTAPDRAFLFTPVQPQPANQTTLTRLLWEGGGDRLAVALREDFFGGFDDWIYVYTSDWAQEFAGSDDTMGTALGAGCGPIAAPEVQDAADLLISEGAIPAGSLAQFWPGTGIIQGAEFLGWLAPDNFAMTLYHEPDVFALAPDGTEHDLSVITGIPTLGEFVTLAATFTKSGSDWLASDCSLTPPAIPVRPAPIPAVTVGAAGVLLADGVALSDQNALAIDGVEIADGSY